MAHFPQQSIQPTGNVTLPSDGIYVGLEARPTPIFRRRTGEAGSRVPWNGSGS